MSWDAATVDELKTMWTSGTYSMESLASYFTTTRGAISGKLDRLGLLGQRREPGAPREKRLRCPPPTE